MVIWRSGERKPLFGNEYKYVDNHEDMEELYDLEADPYELHNLALDEEYQVPLMKMRMKRLELKPE